MFRKQAGAGRDEHINASCYILFDEEDLNKHFILLNQTKLHIGEIQQVWKSIKEITRLRPQGFPVRFRDSTQSRMG